jgi:hypothetical protein
VEILDCFLSVYIIFHLKFCVALSGCRWTQVCCSLLDPGLSWCVGALLHTVEEQDTSHGAAAYELENTQQADSKKQAHHTSKGDCEVRKVSSNKSTFDYWISAIRHISISKQFQGKCKSWQCNNWANNFVLSEGSNDTVSPDAAVGPRFCWNLSSWQL